MDRSEMSTADWITAIDELADAGMMRASLMGGEPLIRKDIGEIIDHLKSRHINTAMNTNGWLIPNRIDDIAKLDLVCITLDGPPEVHDVQRHPGSHDKVLTAIDAAQSRGVDVVTMTVLTPAGSESVDYVLQVAKEKGTRAYFQLQHDAEGDPDKEIGEGHSETGIARIAQHLLRRKDEGWPVGPSHTYLEALARGGTGTRRLHSCDDCYASRYFISITPQGDVIPCPLTFRQEPRLNGRQLGFRRAFEMLAQPTNSGCSCYPLQELNYMLSFRPEVVLNAMRG
jgi:MoaA/NifB/PqqE/SkfB family radical SAM enzyme